MQDGEWQRDLTPEELEWIQPLYAKMINNAKQRGSDSDNPCYILSHPKRIKRLNPKYKVWPLDNQTGKRVRGGPTKLGQHWIAFVGQHQKFPKWYRRTEPEGDDDDDDDDEDVDLREQKGTDKEEADSDDEKEDDPDYHPPCQLSHVCGNSKCIAPGHIVNEFQFINLERKGCHFLIQKLYDEIIAMDPALKDRKVTLIECGHTPSCFLNFGEEEQEVKDRKRRLSARPGFVQQPIRKRRRLDTEKNKKGKTIYCDIAGNEVFVKGWIGDIDGDHIVFCHRYKDTNGRYQCGEKRVPDDSPLLKHEC